MSDLVGNPEDRFSRYSLNEAHIYGSCRKKTCYAFVTRSDTKQPAQPWAYLRLEILDLDAIGNTLFRQQNTNMLMSLHGNAADLGLFVFLHMQKYQTGFLVTQPLMCSDMPISPSF